jgi:hypothetical protein
LQGKTITEIADLKKVVGKLEDTVLEYGGKLEDEAISIEAGKTAPCQQCNLF